MSLITSVGTKINERSREKCIFFKLYFLQSLIGRVALLYTKLTLIKVSTGQKEGRTKDRKTERQRFQVKEREREECDRTGDIETNFPLKRER